MLELLGLSAEAEAVYRVLLAHPYWDGNQITAHLKLSRQQLKAAQQQLAELALVTERESRWVPVSPAVGLSALLASAEAEVVARRQQIEATRAAVMAMTAHGGLAAVEPARRLDGLDAIDARMAELGLLARREILHMTPDRGHDVEVPEGVVVRHLVQASIRYDGDLLARARHLVAAGHEVRTVPAAPMPMAVFDRATALLPVDPGAAEVGMLEVTNSGVVAVACALFDELWFDSVPLDHPIGGTKDDLDPVQRQMLRMLAEGHTDGLVARRLGVSLSTVRRRVALLMDRLDARSRFQAGIRTVERGWLGAPQPGQESVPLG
ncbi:helix-turn-helix transcriptional regulator [Micromonospora sp. NPDC023737]|uniref:helix-turn-helix transcriptional regulator n=1 Tax=unclassified Micromonospora TaxID=2617518 RepID=UPI0033C56FC4